MQFYTYEITYGWESMVVRVKSKEAHDSIPMGFNNSKAAAINK